MGKMVHSTRPVPAVIPPIAQKTYYRDVLKDSISSPYNLAPPCSQETDSWRTGTSVDDDFDDLEDARRIFRNGFTSNDPVYDRGHPFLTTKQEFSLSHPRMTASISDAYGYRYDFVGPISVFPEGPNGSKFPSIPVPVLSSSEIADFGHRAMLNTAPTRPQASLATALGEAVHDGLPALLGAGLLKERASVARSAGGEYLNVQFGWLPLISDVRKIVRSLLNANRTVLQLQRDSGKVVRRRFSFPEQSTSTTTTYVSSGFPVAGTGSNVVWEYNYPDAKSVTVDHRTNRKIWFSGAYSYLVPSSDSLVGRLLEYEQRANVLLGSRVTPEVLWELTPWSWLADWKATIGNSLSIADLTSSDNLVLRYGYLMCHTVTEELYTPTVPFTTKYGLKVSPAARVRRETKQRVQATPYGFGLKLDDFSVKQWAILAALGMTKAPNSLA